MHEGPCGLQPYNDVGVLTAGVKTADQDDKADGNVAVDVTIKSKSHRLRQAQMTAILSAGDTDDVIESQPCVTDYYTIATVLAETPDDSK
jgi:hypothetical protein